MPGRRLLAAFFALVAFPLPACIHINAPMTSASTEEAPKTADATPQSPRILFAELPRMPGAVVRAKPLANTPPPRDSFAQNPVDTAPPNPPKPVEAIATTVGAEPNRFPTLPPAAAVSEPPLLAAVRAYSENRPDRAIEILRGLDKQNQDFVLGVLPILARGATADLNNDPATIAMLVDQLHAAAARLEPRAALRIEKMSFCADVSGFGRFAPWPDNQPYRPNAQAQLYLEVRNLGSEPTNDGFMTHVHATVEIRDAYGKLVEQIDPSDWRRRVPVVHFEKRLGSRSPLRDFHVLYIFSAPATPGVYTITVELRDSTGRRRVKTPPAQFCVAGP